LDKPRKVTRKGFIERFCVYPTRDLFDNFRTAFVIVAARTVRMLGAIPCNKSCPVKKFMHQRVDGDHAAAD
jgi:hypothetical protein